MQAAKTAGNASGNASPTRLAGVEEGAAAGGALGGDGPGDHVARREVAGRVIAAHEGRAVGVHQPRALAAQGFGGQRRRIGRDVDGGRMELDELGIADARAGQGRHGQALAAHAGGIGGHGVEAADPAGRQQGGRGDDLDRSPPASTRAPRTRPAASGEQGARRAAFANLDRGSARPRRRSPPP